MVPCEVKQWYWSVLVVLSCVVEDEEEPASVVEGAGGAAVASTVVDGAVLSVVDDEEVVVVSAIVEVVVVSAIVEEEEEVVTASDDVVAVEFAEARQPMPRRLQHQCCCSSDHFDVQSKVPTSHSKRSFGAWARPPPDHDVHFNGSPPAPSASSMSVKIREAWQKKASPVWLASAWNSTTKEDMFLNRNNTVLAVSA